MSWRYRMRRPIKTGCIINNDPPPPSTPVWKHFDFVQVYTSVSSAYNLNGRLSQLSVSQRAAVRDNTLYPDHHLRHRILPNVFSHLCEHLMLIMKDKKTLFVGHAFFGICSTSSICRTSMPKWGFRDSLALYADTHSSGSMRMTMRKWKNISNAEVPFPVPSSPLLRFLLCIFKIYNWYSALGDECFV